MSIESHCTTDCNITADIYVTTYHSYCVANLLFIAQNDLSRNGLIEPIEQHLFRENSNVHREVMCIQSFIINAMSSHRFLSDTFKVCLH